MCNVTLEILGRVGPLSSESLQYFSDTSRSLTVFRHFHLVCNSLRMKAASPAQSATEPLASYYLRRLMETVELAGATFCGFQRGWGEDLVLFNHPVTGSTLALPLSELSVDNICAKVAASVY